MMAPTIFFQPRSRHAFTLLEMIAVMAILLVLLIGSVGVFRGMGDTRDLTAGGDMVQLQLNAAHQSALASGMPVRWQLLNIVDPRNGDATAFRLIRIEQFNAKERTWRLLDRMRLLPRSIRTDTSASTLLEPTALQVESAISFQGEVIPTAQAATVIFFPNGETSLNPVAIHSLTLRNPRLSDDFITIQIDPVTGQTRFFRP